MKKNIGAGWLYFYIHFLTEIACFYVLGNVTGNSVVLWLVPFVYDALAFVPQSLIGYISDRFPKINIGITGTVLLFFGVIFSFLDILPGRFTALTILCIGNCCLHISGAETTLRVSDGHLSHSAIFVGGGSFGVITGRLLAASEVPFLLVSALVLTMIPFVLLADLYRNKADEKSACPCVLFDYHSKKIPPVLIVILTVFVVIVRGYMGYGIPTTWNKSVIQNVIFYVTMGIGKMLGGVLSDLIGIRKTAVLSVAAAVPFLLFGDNVMLISLVGVMLFSMTMPITLAVLVSVLKYSPGLAFGLTTIGLFLGTAPIFFFKFTTFTANATVIIVLSVLCVAVLLSILGKDAAKNGRHNDTC
ncbi:MAG: hypothetical protein IJB86_06085 [Clostridia bacterium]|nr:hypothetical protein [Clostridia bacterium]